MFYISSCCCLCAIFWRQLFSREWRCSWSSVDRRCSNYIWVINNFITSGVPYIRDFMVVFNMFPISNWHVTIPLCWGASKGTRKIPDIPAGIDVQWLMKGVNIQTTWQPIWAHETGSQCTQYKYYILVELHLKKYHSILLWRHYRIECYLTVIFLYTKGFTSICPQQTCTEFIFCIQWNTISHWPGAYTKWSLHVHLVFLWTKTQLNCLCIRVTSLSTNLSIISLQGPLLP